MQILVQLAAHPAPSVADLARRLDNALRPSVSRSLHGLERQGLVTRGEPGWHLTGEGKREAERSREALEAMPERMVAEIARVNRTLRRSGATVASLSIANAARAMSTSGLMDMIRQGGTVGTALIPETMTALWGMVGAPAIDAIREMGRVPRPDELMDGSIAELMRDIGLTGTADIVRKATGIGSTDALRMASGLGIASSLVETMQLSSAISRNGSALGLALTGLVAAQERNGALAVAATARETLAQLPFVRQNGLLLASAVDDVLALRWCAEDQLNTGARAMLAMTSADLGPITGSLAALYRDHLLGAGSPDALKSLFIPDQLTVPTAMVAWYTRSARDLVAAEADPDQSFTAMEEAEDSGDSRLDPLLVMLDPDFVEQRRGAWSALRWKGPDYLRQAAISQRALLEHVLQLLVPGHDLAQHERQGPQTKARVRAILGRGESGAQYVESIAIAIYHLYTQLCNYTHGNRNHEDTLRGTLRIGEGLIYLLLTGIQPEAEE